MKVLDPHIRMIQGDGIDKTMGNSILNVLIQYGFSIDNITFGSGGGLLRKHDRDNIQWIYLFLSLKMEKF